MTQDQGSEVIQPALQEPPKIDRRQLFGNAAKAIAGTAAAITIGREVKQTVEGKVETAEGIFYPLYEVHKYPIEKLPEKCDVYFREQMTAPNVPDLLTDQQVTNLLKSYAIKDELTQHGTKIALGDVIPTSYPSSPDIVFGIAMVVEANAPGMTAAAVGATLGATVLETKDSPLKKMSRRTAIGFLGAATYSATTAGNLLLDQDTLSQGLNQKDPTGDALGRITVKVNGLISDFHPEIALLFFRNAVWAHKLLEYSKKLETELKRKPNFALAIGAAHAGVEDFLTLGEDFIERIITAYPRGWLEGVIASNGGPKNFSTLRFIDPKETKNKGTAYFQLFEDEKLTRVLDDFFKKDPATYYPHPPKYGVKKF